MYGRRATLDINPNNNQNKTYGKLARRLTKKEEEELMTYEKITWKQRIIIPPEAKWKSIFDIFILLLVGYSCIINIIFVSYVDFPEEGLTLFNNTFVEGLFYIDFIL